MKADRLPAPTQTAASVRRDPPLPGGGIRRVGAAQGLAADRERSRRQELDGTVHHPLASANDDIAAQAHDMARELLALGAEALQLMHPDERARATIDAQA